MDRKRTGKTIARKLVLACCLGWFVPGAGHLLLGRAQKGFIFLVAIPLMYVLGLWFQGQVFTVDVSQPLVALSAIAQIGVGALYILARLIDLGSGGVVAVTYEYGNSLLVVSGLLNMLVVVDVFDVAMGRK